ncbi:MAG: N-formylglutamate amidohydrolase [Deltaproteobacteria bacterium]|nr:N-formylglutamate amidohydrolase [Deltaproteobacteria bacterium]
MRLHHAFATAAFVSLAASTGGTRAFARASVNCPTFSEHEPDADCAGAAPQRYFGPTIDRIIIRTPLKNVKSGDKISYEWIDPSGNRHYSKSFSIASDAKKRCSWNYIGIKGARAAEKSGVWKVKVSYNGEERCTATFHLLTDLVVVEPGDLPIVITAPHGGTSEVTGVYQRTATCGTLKGDQKTLDVATKIRDEVKALLGRAPYLVAAKFGRKWIDANRSDATDDPEARAYDDPNARPVHAAYHRAVRDAVDAARAKFGKAILVDVHGQSGDGQEETIHRGTRNGQTVTDLVSRCGVAALVGPKSLFGALAQAGYKIFPPPGVAPDKKKENPNYGGGFTVSTYGSHNANGVDAVQMEIGVSLRTDDVKRKKLKKDIAAAVKTFYDAFLKTPCATTDPSRP